MFCPDPPSKAGPVILRSRWCGGGSVSWSGVLLFVVSATLFHPFPAGAQEDSCVVLDAGDQVRVYGDGLLEGKRFDYVGTRSDSLLLHSPSQGRDVKLSWNRIDRLQVREATGETHLWEGALVGTGVGVLAYGIASVPLTVEWTGGAAVLASATVLPGAVLGGLVGAGFPKYAWVAARRPASMASVSFGISARRGVAISLSVPLPPDP